MFVYYGDSAVALRHNNIVLLVRCQGRR